MTLVVKLAVAVTLVLGLGATRHSPPEALATPADSRPDPVECWSDAPTWSDYAALTTGRS